MKATFIGACAAIAVAAGAQAQDMMDHGTMMAPPDAPFAKVSDLVPLPEFIPGMGELYVDPATLPAGPFAAYDRDGELVSTIYMIPLDDISPDGGFDNLATVGHEVDHVDVAYNAGHPGVDVPHAHIVLWHVSEEEEARVAQ